MDKYLDVITQPCPKFKGDLSKPLLKLECIWVHDDVIKWKHFPRYWPFVRGIHRSPVNSPHKGQWRGALMFCLIRAWINSWVNNCEAGDLRRYLAHCDVIVMNYIPLLEMDVVTYPCPDIDAGLANLCLLANTLRPRQDGGHLPDNISKCIFLNENVWISIKISLKFLPKGPVNNIPALVQIMAWHRPGTD